MPTRDRENRQFEILYEAEVQEFVSRKRTYETNKGKAYALIFGQCNKALQSKLQSRADFESEIKGKPIALLNAIEEHATSYLENKYDAVIVIDSLRNMVNLKQKEDEDLVDFTRRF